jgi:molecular chaperone Hsp33
MDLKADGLLALQITNGSVIRMVVADITTAGHMRACATWNQDALDTILASFPEPSLAQLFEGGSLVFTLEMNHANERHQAIIELNGATLSECMHHYFRQSEQIPTAIYLTSDLSGQKGYGVGALLIQKTPRSSLDLLPHEQEEDDWFTAISLLSTVTSDELLSKTLDPSQLLFHLFHERSVGIHPEKSLHAQCHCSKQRIADVLLNFSANDREAMYIADSIEVVCEFCSERYYFHRNEFI